MGREIKRVALGFDWPLKKVWEGFINPYYAEQIKCPQCDGSGYSKEAKYFSDQWYGYEPFDPYSTGSRPFLPDERAIQVLTERNIGQMGDDFLMSFYGTRNRDIAKLHEAYRLIEHFNSQWMHHLAQEDVDALVEEDRLWDFTRTPRTDEQREIVKQKVASGSNSWLPESNGYIPTAAEINQWSLTGLGHDSINCWVCVEARCKRLGLPATCDACDGSGDVSNPELEARIEAWEETPPPEGDGWQLWETVSEGSPVSPVFPDAEGLISWLVNDQGYSPQAARAFVNKGWAPSMMGVEGVGVWDGITASGILEAKEREHTAD